MYCSGLNHHFMASSVKKKFENRAHETKEAFYFLAEVSWYCQATTGNVFNNWLILNILLILKLAHLCSSMAINRRHRSRPWQGHFSQDTDVCRFSRHCRSFPPSIVRSSSNQKL